MTVPSKSVTGGNIMNMKTLALALGLGVGAAAGAVGILMMSRNSPARRLATEAANKVEDVTWRLTDKMTQSFDM